MPSPLPARRRTAAAVEQVAGHRFVDAEIEPGPHRRVERGEAEQRDARPAGQRHGAERGRGDDAERSLRADEQLRQVNGAVSQYVVEQVPAAVEAQTGPVDEIAVGTEQLGHGPGDLSGSPRFATSVSRLLADEVRFARVPHHPRPAT